jgi:hypothetical protein
LGMVTGSDIAPMPGIFEWSTAAVPGLLVWADFSPAQPDKRAAANPAAARPRVKDLFTRVREEANEGAGRVPISAPCSAASRGRETTLRAVCNLNALVRGTVGPRGNPDVRSRSGKAEARELDPSRGRPGFVPPGGARKPRRSRCRRRPPRRRRARQRMLSDCRARCHRRSSGRAR